MNSGFFLFSVLRNTETKNVTHSSEFHLLELSEDPVLQPILFGLFLSMYLVTVLGNLLIILAVSSDSHLHTPMYFFLCNLSLADIGFISSIVPKMISDTATHNRVISYVGCLTQMSTFLFFGCMDYMLLTVMAYDRFVAICHPLHYTTLMSPGICGIFILFSVVLSILDSLTHNLIALHINCFKDMAISNFFCDPSQVLSLVCSENLASDIVRYFVLIVYGVFPILGILYSYYKIISSILRIPETSGKCKAFSTCSSHLSVVCSFYGTGGGVYIASSLSHSTRKSLVASIIYTVVTPMLNPFIYSLRNKDFKNSLSRLYGKNLIS